MLMSPNKDETAVHGQGDMAVRMRKVMQIAGLVFECVTCCFRVSLRISRSFEGHCALTNADEANEVQQNVVTAKKGKKRGIKAILRRSR